jgi:hypothetical protein
MNARDLTARSGPNSLPANVGAARAHGGDPPWTTARARWGPRVPERAQGGSRQRGEHGCGLGNNAKAPKGSCPRRDGLAAAEPCSDEQLRTHEGSKGEIRGTGRLVTSREDSGTLERWQGHDKASGRRRWHSSYTMKVR